MASVQFHACPMVWGMQPLWPLRTSRFDIPLSSKSLAQFVKSLSTQKCAQHRQILPSRKKLGTSQNSIKSTLLWLVPHSLLAKKFALKKQYFLLYEIGPRTVGGGGWTGRKRGGLVEMTSQSISHICQKQWDYTIHRGPKGHPCGYSALIFSPNSGMTWHNF